jgi:DNA-binding PadR family transcriptional regulator
MFSASTHNHDHEGHDPHEQHDHPRGGRGARRGFGPGGPAFGPGAGFGPGFGGFGPRGFRPPGPQRKRRGDVRMAIVSLLGEAPSNGYALIKGIAERSGGTWTPSPGSVYPTLQQLVDEQLIESTGEAKRPEYQLTDAGRTFATENAAELEALWSETQAEASVDAGLHESVAKLMGVVHQFRFAATDEQRAAAVAKIDDTRRSLYGILAE